MTAPSTHKGNHIKNKSAAAVIPRLDLSKIKSMVEDKNNDEEEDEDNDQADADQEFSEDMVTINDIQLHDDLLDDKEML